MISLFYLATLPLVLFSGQSLVLLTTSLILGYLLYILFQKSSLKHFALFALTLLLTFAMVKPKLGLDLSLLNTINAERGEHTNYQNSLLAKVLHNKLDLSQSFINNLDSLISPKAIFASGFWHHLSPYYSLGYLFPWDIYFIYRFFKSFKSKKPFKDWYFFSLAITLLVLFTGMFYVDQALIFAFALIFFLAFLSAESYGTLSKKAQAVMISLNLLFLLYQAIVMSYFRI